MKAMAVFPSSRELRLVEHPEPELSGARQVKLRILETGICGTDREIASFAYGMAPGDCAYLILGHEALGEVVEVGGEATSLAPGDLAVLTVRRPCPHEHCVPCIHERQDFCLTGDFTERGIKEAHGYMAEYAVEDERFLVRVPPELRNVAVLTEPLTVAEKAMEQAHVLMSRMPGGDDGSRRRPAVVLGAGPIGLLGAMKLRDCGYETWVYSRDEPDSANFKIVSAMGARFVDAQRHSPGELAEMAGDIGLVYEAAGVAKVSFEVLGELGVNGVFIFSGIPALKAPLEVDSERIMRNMVLKNQAIAGTVNAGHASYKQALTDLASFLRRFPSAVNAMITARVPLEGAREDLLRRGGVKTVVDMV
ncbi:MAG: glucose 1-dehydrogenase [Desulfovibrionaceae bacterium]|nr:glucose 1-dehydrogenase [Desulfovibrionaceae bacterium]MBF0513231.1 glucose 1-dehydrogenase [Desulfovibrionaceae bacterium]